MGNSDTTEAVAWTYTVTPIVTDKLDQEDVPEPFEKVSFEHPDETYGKYNEFEISNVRKLTEVESDE